MSCSICFENIKSKREFSHFICAHCKTEICKTCLKSCLITYGSTIPKCPNCGENILYLTLAKLFSKTFVKKTIFEHLANLEFEVATKEKVKLVSPILVKLICSTSDPIKLEITTKLNNELIREINYNSCAELRRHKTSNEIKGITDSIVQNLMENTKPLLEQIKLDYEQNTKNKIEAIIEKCFNQPSIDDKSSIDDDSKCTIIEIRDGIEDSSNFNSEDRDYIITEIQDGIENESINETNSQRLIDTTSSKNEYPEINESTLGYFQIISPKDETIKKISVNVYNPDFNCGYSALANQHLHKIISVTDLTIRQELEKIELQNMIAKIKNVIKDVFKILFTMMSYLDIREILNKNLKEYIDFTLLDKTLLLDSNSIRIEIKNMLKEETKKDVLIFRCLECEHGFINSEFICNMCSKKFCNNCLKELTDNHECLKEDIETMNLILKDTRPCPNCCTRIYKISGCSQMFCTYCKTGFDWNTGKKINHNFHNPHRMEWLEQLHRSGGENPNPDEICEEDYRITFIERVQNQRLNKMLYYLNYINEELGYKRRNLQNLKSEKTNLTDLVLYLFTKYYTEKTQNENDKEKNISFLKSKHLYIDEKKYKSIIKKNLKKINQLELMIDVYETMVACLRSTLIRVDQLIGFQYARYRNYNLNQEIKDKIEKYCNTCCDIIKDIEKNRIIDLETYFDTNFIRPVDFNTKYSFYSWTSKDSGCKSFEELEDTLNTLFKEPKKYSNVTPFIRMSINSKTKPKFKKLYDIYSYYREHCGLYKLLRPEHIDNIRELNLTSEEKNYVYTALFRN